MSIDYDKIFKKGKEPVKNMSAYLIALRGHKCEKCCLTHWQDQLITLQTHHIDGDRTNNELNNLLLLCPNCHSQTENFGSKNIKKITISEEKFVETLKNSYSIRQALLSLGLSDASANYVRAKTLIQKYDIEMPNKISTKLKKYCKVCGKEIHPTAEHCTKCFYLLSRKVERPSREELKNLIRTQSFVSISKQFGVSDTAIKKWAIVEGLPYKKSEIKTYSDEEWAKI